MATAAPATKSPKAQPPKLRHTFWWYLKCFFIGLQLIVFCAIVVAATMGYTLYQELEKVTPDIRTLLARNKAESTQVFAADGSLLAEFKVEDRKWTPISEIKRNPANKQNPGGRLIDATLSIEDSRFYLHPGMDPKRIAGALVANYKSGGIEQGGSTITEQLVKLVYLNRSRTVSRRLNTALIALQLERRLSKDEILEAYLNEIYYGNGAHGCGAAAKRYFNTDPQNLTIAQAAMLAGLPQNPVRLDPFDHFDRAQRRQKLVLHEMYQNKRISYGQWKEALADTSVAADIARNSDRYRAERRKKDKWKSPYFVSYVRQYLMKQYQWTDDYLNRGGLRIYTTLDPKIQQDAENAVKNQINRLGRPGLQGALVCIDPWSGQVIAMVGGKNYYDTDHNGEWNRAVQGKRQVGSTMKPYIYSAAMEAGMSPDTVIVDSPLWVCGDSECPPGHRSKRYGAHEVRNYDRTHHGAMALRRALGMSNNVVATRVLLKVGIQNAIQKAHLMGVQSALAPYPSLALGVSDMSLLEHVSAYGAFATKGLRAEATPITRVETPTGETLVEQPTPVRAARVLSPGAANSMYEMLRYVVTSGTGKAASIPGVEVLGKTGTTSSNKDVWFMGATPDLVAGVWMGYDRPRELYGSAGGRWCAPVWRSFMVDALAEWKKRQPVKRLIEDARATAQRRLIAEQNKQYVRVRICNESGLLATSACPKTHWEEFSAAAGAPTQYCDIHQRNNSAPRSLGDSLPSTNSHDSAGDLGYDPARDGDTAGGAGQDNRRQTEPEDDGQDLNAPARREYWRDNQRDQSTGADTGGDNGTLMDDPGGPDFSPPPAAGDTGTPVRRSPTSTTVEPESEVVVTVCADSGLVANRRCPVTVQQTFLASQAPKRICNVH